MDRPCTVNNNIVIAYSACGLWELTTAGWTELCCTDFLWGKQGCLPPLLKIYFWSLNTYTTVWWLMLPPSLGVEWVTSHVHPCAFKFFSVWQIFSLTYMVLLNYCVLKYVVKVLLISYCLFHWDATITSMVLWKNLWKMITQEINCMI